MRRGIALAAAAAFLLAASAGTAGARPSVDAYRGPGAWVDIYSGPALRNPEGVVGRLRREGVRTLYLETANWRRSPTVQIVHPAPTERFLDAAHAAGLRVVAWYLPGLAEVEVDFDRALAAIEFQTLRGNRFDGFALDIEATLVRSIPARNAALLALSRNLRSAVGPDRALGAIVPDGLSTSCRGCLWPGFPYRSVARLYDVFLPMTYSTFRGRGARFVRAYIAANVDRIRTRSGRPGVPVHPVGGLAHGLRLAEARAVVAAARSRRAVGVSFYNFGLSGPEEWAALRGF